MPDQSLFAIWKQQARSLKIQTLALYYAYRDPRVAWYAKAWIILIVAYAFSPIDLIPDFIPVLGYLDDLIIVPLGVFVALKMIPSQVMEESRAKAAQNADRPQFRGMIWVVVVLWALAILLVGWVVYRVIRK